MTNQNEFKRPNFFKGMFTTAEDWRDGHDYHIEKLKLHHRGLHKPGVIHHVDEELGVRFHSLANGVLELEVSPGAAVDGHGNIIYLASKRPVKKNISELQKGDDNVKCIYVGIRYSERPVDFVANHAQPEYSGHTRNVEDPCVFITDVQPDDQSCLQLACIKLTHDAKSITAPQDPQNPCKIEIDRTQVQWSLSTECLEERIVDLDGRLQEEEGTSLEHANQLDALHEQTSSLGSRLDQEEATSSSLATISTEHTTRLDWLEPEVGALDSRLVKEEAITPMLQETARQHGERLDRLDGEVDRLDKGLKTEEDISHNHRDRLNGLDGQIEGIDKRLTSEEYKSSSLQTTTAEHEEKLKVLDVQTFDLGTRLTTEETTSFSLLATTAVFGERLDGLDAQATGFHTRLTQEEATSTSLLTTIDAHSQRLNGLDTRLAGLSLRLDQLTARVDGLAGTSLLHYRGSHTLGVVPQEGEQLQVKAAGGLNVRVLPGAALDRDGNTLIVAQERALTIDQKALNVKLPQLVFVAVRYDAAAPGNAYLRVLPALPASEPWLELARIDLQPSVTEIADPVDPDNPGGNQIDRRSAPRSGAIAVRAQGMSDTMVQRIGQIMGRSRRSFADLDMEFPTPSVGDARYVCLTVETTARVGRLDLDRLADLMATAAAIEQDVEQELARKYGKLLTTTDQFNNYGKAVRNLNAAVRGRSPDAILTRQDEVAAAAQKLAVVVIEDPIADAGRDQELITYEDRIVATLDGSDSQGRGGRAIKRYRWRVSAS